MFENAKSWPFQEARKLLEHIAKKGKKPGDVVTFETGYGPSGAPHIGTFAEVIRTLWVMRAFDELTGEAYQTRLIMFSDDYDALRKVPDGLPEWMNNYLGWPLSLVPDPDQPEPERYALQMMVDPVSFAEINNNKLIKFVDDILIHYDGNQVGASPDRSRVSFVSSSRYYKSGKFNSMLDRIWDNYDAIQAIMLPSVGEERRATYSPFMPVMPFNWYPRNTVLQVPVTLRKPYSIYFDVPDDARTHMGCSIHGGNVKLQWKVDWAMRWVHFDVDYEMSGKDLIESVRLSSKICRVLGGTPPLNLTYELFLDEHGAKISKSKGNGFSIEDWLQVGTYEGLMLFMFQNPRQAKKLYRDLVPGIEDQYIASRTKELTPDVPAWHFTTIYQAGLLPDISYQLMVNLARVSQVGSGPELITYLEENRAVDPLHRPWLLQLAKLAIEYSVVSGLYNRNLRIPTDAEQAAFKDLADRLSTMEPGLDAEAYQFQVYEVGKDHNFEPLRTWFQALYECFLGDSSGPRFGAFIAANGLQNTIKILRMYEDGAQ